MNQQNTLFVKLTFLFLINVCFSTISYSQISFDSNYYEKLNVDSAEFDHRFRFSLKNDSLDAADTNFIWELTYINIPENWEYILIFPDHCGYLEPVISGPFILPNNSEIDLRLDFITFATSDSGTIHLKVSSALNPSNKDSAVFKVISKSLVSIDLPEIVTNIIYPNPASDLLKIQCEPNSNYQIINMQGQLMSEGKLSNPINFVDVHDLLGGTYFINVIFGEHVSVQKVIIN